MWLIGAKFVLKESKLLKTRIHEYTHLNRRDEDLQIKRLFKP